MGVGKTEKSISSGVIYQFFILQFFFKIFSRDRDSERVGETLDSSAETSTEARAGGDEIRERERARECSSRKSRGSKSSLRDGEKASKLYPRLAGGEKRMEGMGLLIPE